MARENKLLASKKETSVNSFLSAVGADKIKENRVKTHSISVYEQDKAVLMNLVRYIQDQTGQVNVSVSKIYRAALLCAKADSKFLAAYEKID